MSPKPFAAEIQKENSQSIFLRTQRRNEMVLITSDITATWYYPAKKYPVSKDTMILRY
jgi:hypothetical protein